MSHHEEQPLDLVATLRRTLLALARQQADRAASEAARVPYWCPRPSSVDGHLAAAEALRQEADRLLASSAA